MREALILVFSLLAVSLPMLFWVRGLIRGNKGDLVAGAALLFGVSLGIRMTNPVSSHFSSIGALWLLFGMATWVGGSWAGASGPLKKRDRAALGWLFVILGLLGSLIV